ncbi:replication/maintenance protein RepL [Providencia rustigianii]|uniref:Firmicute plasmid replication protein (RepL) n=1 Tax=Providencia rustigianii DSM 4541 TaxID=500637 RepID=D1P806_9GAMM|nr:replication/maintenance protein RepL [Providencia rustigianii]EFB70449.1 firmicute plasmid replication protein (RepL) [Providencia rustigianii DSM 4541]MBP6436061.1 replication/maintenance protein RepL [Paludibacteraceae bacterium]SUD70734.1 Firmicute plasmid replication protein (RepL) [Providencia rustigianii]
MKKQTFKKTKVVGKQTYINQTTGEVVDMNVVETTFSDFNFEKIWLSHLLQALDCLGSKKIKVVSWLLENKDSKNTVIATQRKIAIGCDVSLQTVVDVMKVLLTSDVIRMEQQGVYILNPEVIFKGDKSKRMNVLIKYNKL